MIYLPSKILMLRLMRACAAHEEYEENHPGNFLKNNICMFYDLNIDLEDDISNDNEQKD